MRPGDKVIQINLEQGTELSAIGIEIKEVLYSKGYGRSKPIEIDIMDPDGIELDTTDSPGSSEFRLLVEPGTFSRVSFQNSN